MGWQTVNSSGFDVEIGLEAALIVHSIAGLAMIAVSVMASFG
jgi:hypothetical protein